MLNPTDVILETWNRNTTVVLNILNALPEGGIDARDTGGEWTVAHHLSDMQGANVHWLQKSAPDFALGLEVLYTEDASSPLGFVAERDIAKIKSRIPNCIRRNRSSREASYGNRSTVW